MKRRERLTVPTITRSAPSRIRAARSGILWNLFGKTAKTAGVEEGIHCDQVERSCGVYLNFRQVCGDRHPPTDWYRPSDLHASERPTTFLSEL